MAARELRLSDVLNRRVVDVDGRPVGPLEDARVQVFEGDICQLFRDPKARFDVILLDIGLPRPVVHRPRARSEIKDAYTSSTRPCKNARALSASG